MNKVRVRYAPSPTGHLHIGGARTALFNYLFAKHHNGDFIFRLEDTDVERNIENGEASQLDNLKWLNIIPDESPLNPGAYGPYRQTEKLEIYRNLANQLVNEGKAYECYCTPEELDESRKRQEANGNFSFRYEKTCMNLTPEQKKKYQDEGRVPSIRLNVNHDSVYTWDDIVRDKISFEGKDVSDWVIIKSNGIATYNFAVVVDDHDMEISHIFRGEEHISNTPKQLMVYEAFGWQPPQFGHMTLIVNEERKKLSKRDETVMQFISQYKNEGYLSDAMFNFFALLGWSPEGEKEIMSISELIKDFDANRLSKSPSMFDKKKLQWVCNEYIKAMDLKDVVSLVKPFLSESYDLSKYSDQWIENLVAIYHPQLSHGKEIVELSKDFFIDAQLTNELVDTLNELDAKKVVEELLNEFSKATDFDKQSIKDLINNVGKNLEVKGKNLFMPARISTTYQKSGADLSSTLELYGKEQVIKNLESTLKHL